MEYEQAITLCGGYGTYQKLLFLLVVPIGFTFVFGVSSMAYVMPAAVCEFEISTYRQGLIYSAIYLGMVPFGAFWGIVADMIGRKKTLILTCGFAGFFEFLSGFSPNYWFMFFCKLAAGCTISGVHLTYYIYLSEFTDPENKDTITMLSGAAAAFGYFLQPLIAAFLIPLKMKFVLIPDLIVFNSWKIFLIISSSAPILGFLISTFIIKETPKFLLILDKKQESLDILKDIYVTNTGKPAETFPIKDIKLKEDENTDKQIQRKEKSESTQSSSGSIFQDRVLPLFRYPYLIPAVMSFLAQANTMGAYNSVRPYVPTLFSLALGIGQVNSSSHVDYQQEQFCVLFKTQETFKPNIHCNEDELVLDSRVFYGSTIVGLCVFLSFFGGKEVVNFFGKGVVFVMAHVISAISISLFPFATAKYALLIICLYSVCMQNCLTIAIGLMIGRIPTHLRGLTVSIIMVCGRIGVIIGNQVLPIITNISCTTGFFTVALINLTAIPIIFVYSRQPNPIEDEAMKAAKTVMSNTSTPAPK